MTRPEKIIIAVLAALAVAILAVFGCLLLTLRRGPVADPRPTPAALVQPSPTPLLTPTPPPPVEPTETARPTPTGTRVVTLTVQPTPQPTPVNCIDDIHDFGASGVITNEEVQAYLRQTIPLSHLDRCLGIRYIPKSVSVQATPAAGRFIPLFRQISVYAVDPELQSSQDLLDTLTHEVGHNVHFNMRIDNWELAMRWTELHRQSQDIFARRGLGFVSDYARVNEFEDFAESYMAYVRRPQLLKAVSPEKYEFMREEVFAGREYVP